MRPVAAPRARRTQEERREATIRRLLDAATEALIDDGYAGTTIQVIAARAGVSHGGLFRHFATREALMVAVGEDVGRRILVHYRRRFEALRGREEPIALALRLVRDHCRSRLNQAWFELVMAARTNPTLRKALQPAGSRYHADIQALARDVLPDVAATLGPRFPVLVDTVVALFDGEVVHHALAKRPALAVARLEMLASLARALTAP